jgi:hypothetical protein
MEASWELVGELLINPNEAPVRKYNLEELVHVLEKYKYMSSPSIKNDVTACGVQVYSKIWGHGRHRHA